MRSQCLDKVDKVSKAVGELAMYIFRKIIQIEGTFGAKEKDGSHVWAEARVHKGESLFLKE